MSLAAFCLNTVSVHATFQCPANFLHCSDVGVISPLTELERRPRGPCRPAAAGRVKTSHRSLIAKRVEAIALPALVTLLSSSISELKDLVAADSPVI